MVKLSCQEQGEARNNGRLEGCAVDPGAILRNGTATLAQAVARSRWGSALRLVSLSVSSVKSVVQMFGFEICPQSRPVTVSHGDHFESDWQAYAAFRLPIADHGQLERQPECGSAKPVKVCQSALAMSKAPGRPRTAQEEGLAHPIASLLRLLPFAIGWIRGQKIRLNPS